MSFIRLSKGRTTDKLAINWQAFAQVEFQLKFAFRIQPVAFKAMGDLELEFFFAYPMR